MWPETARFTSQPGHIHYYLRPMAVTDCHQLPPFPEFLFSRRFSTNGTILRSWVAVRTLTAILCSGEVPTHG